MCNAGIMMGPRRVSVDGVELQARRVFKTECYGVLTQL